MLASIFQNIVILTDPTQANQQEFIAAQKFLSDFSKQNSKNYQDFFSVISSNSSQIQISESQLSQVQFWMANELIKIVLSDEFREKWNLAERKQFKEFFLDWLFQNIEVLSPMFINKFSLLFMNLFEKMAEIKRQEQYEPEWQNGYAEFLDIFFNIERYPDFALYLQGQDCDQTQLKIQSDRYRKFVRFIQTSLIDCLKYSLNWGKDDTTGPKRDISAIMNVQQTFSHYNVVKILIFIERLEQMRIRNLDLVINNEIQVSNWKILTKFLRLRFHGFNNLSQYKFFIDQAIANIQKSTDMEVTRQCFNFLTEFVNSDLFVQHEKTDMEIDKKNKFVILGKKQKDVYQKLQLVQLVQEAIHNTEGFVYQTLMTSREDSLSRDKLIANLSKYLSCSITFFRRESENIQNMLLNIVKRQNDSSKNSQQFSVMIDQMAETMQENTLIQQQLTLNNPDLPRVSSFSPSDISQRMIGIGLNNYYPGMDENKFKECLKIHEEEIKRLKFAIQQQLDSMMELTFYLIKQSDVKINVNACQIVYDYLLHVMNAQGGTIEEQKTIFQQVFDQIVPVFEQHYILKQDERIRLSKYATSMQTNHEEFFQRMRSLFQKLMSLFLKTDSLAEAFALRITYVISSLKQQTERGSILRTIELIYKMIDILISESVLFNNNSRFNQVDQSMLQKFVSQQQIIQVLYDREIYTLINQDDALGFYSLHNSLRQIFKNLIDTSFLDPSYYCQRVTELTSTILINEDNLLNVVIYLTQQITNKINTPDSEETSPEECFLFSEQIEMLLQIFRSNKISKEYISEIQQQFSTNFRVYLSKLVNTHDSPFLLQQSDLLKIYLRCLMITDQKDMVIEIPRLLSQAIKGKKEINCLKKLVEILDSEIDYLFMQKKMFYIQLEQMQMDTREKIRQVESYLELIHIVIEETKKENERLLQLILQRKLSSSLTNIVVNMTLSMQKMMASLKLNQPESFKDINTANSTSFANQICAQLIQDLNQIDQVSEHEQRIFKYELTNGILKLFMEQGISLFDSEHPLYEQDSCRVEAILYYSQIDLLLTKIANMNLGVVIIQYLIQAAQSSQGQSQKEIDLKIETQFSLLYILRGVTILGSGFIGIQNQEQIAQFVQYLSNIALNGHYSKVNVFRVFALQIIRNITYEMLYDNQFNQNFNYFATRQYPNLDPDYERQKQDAIMKLNMSIFSQRPNLQDVIQQILPIQQFILEKQIYFCNPMNSVKILQMLDKLNFLLLWKLGSGKVSCYEVRNGDFVNSNHCQILIEQCAMIMVGMCHVFPNHEQDKERYYDFNQRLFAHYTKPTMDQVFNFIDVYIAGGEQDPETQLELIKRRILKPDIFSLVAQKIDDSYPKRMWRLSKNIALRYNSKFWSNCFELKDCLLDYIRNSYQTAQDGQTTSRFVMSPGQPVSKKEFLDRFYQNIKEYYKQIEENDGLNHDQDDIVNQFINYYN